MKVNMLGRNLPKGIIRANYKCQYENPYNAFLTISNLIIHTLYNQTTTSHLLGLSAIAEN